MRRFRRFALYVLCASLLSLVAPVLPARAAPTRAHLAQVGQEDQQAIALRIAEIRDRAPDVLDDFGSNEDNWELTYDSDGSIYYKAGQLRVAVEATETLLWTQGAYDSTNYYLELDVEHHEGALDNQIGVIFRFIDSDNYYLYSISSDGYYSLFQLRDDEWETVLDWTSSKLIETGAGSVNTLGILAEDATVTLIVNDYILDQATMPTTDGMGIGLAAGAFDEPPIDVGYDELRLWQLNPTDSGPPPIRIPGRVTPDSEAIPTGEPTEEPVEEATPTPAPTEEPVEEATPTPVATEEPVEEATPTPVATEEPVEEATPTLVATEEPVEEATPTPVATEEPVEEVTPTPTPAPIDEPGLGYANSIPVDDPVIAAIQAGAPTYIEEFEQALTDWSPYATTGITYDVVDGALQIDIASPSSLGWSGLPSYPTSYYLEVDIATAETFPEAESGILYNYQSAQDFDFFAINNTGSYSHWRLRNNQWEEVVGWTEGDMLNTGPDNVNRLGLLVQDGQTTLVANGEVLDVIEEAQPLSGALALAAGTFTEGGLIVRFDNLALWDLVQGLPVEPIATPVPPATAADRIAEIQATEADFSDDFRRDTGAWETDVDDYSSSFYERRALHVEVTGPNRSAWATFVDAPGTPANLTDFYIEFDAGFVTQGVDNATGLTFRMVDATNYYMLSVSENGYLNLVKRIDGEWIDLTPWMTSDAIDTNVAAINRIGVLSEGATLAVTINGEVVTVAEDSDLTAGAIGLLAQAFTAESAEVSFDNVLLWILE